MTGLPLHPLIVHFVVVAFPGAAVLLLLSAFWPAARRRLGIITPLLALASLIAVPLATSSGESLEERVDGSALLETHIALTGSRWALRVLSDLRDYLGKFWLVKPKAADIATLVQAIRAAA